MSRILSQEAAQRVRQGVQEVLAGFAPDEGSPLPPQAQQAEYLASYLQRRATTLQTPAERRQQAELDRMIQSPADKATLTQMTDQAFRAQLPHRSADQLVHILDVQGVPRFFSTLDRTLLKGFQTFGAYLPGVAIPLVKEKMQHETANVILPAESEVLSKHLNERRDEGLRMNVNFLGEALLGEAAAERRLQSYLQALERPEIEVLSVKISTIYSQILPIAHQHVVRVLGDRLELLFRAAAKHQFARPDGTLVPKFVYLDMEEYRDKEITVEALIHALDRPEMDQVQAGIALQAYVPDSFLSQQRLTQWARRRVAQGGAPITIRIVKGANLEMERVEASLAGWPLPTYKEKVDTDANYLRMLQHGMQPENLTAVRLGVASHNLFTLAHGLVLAAEQDALDKVQFEMLEGMANHQRRALFELSHNLLLYAPTCRQEDFVHAIGYLVRRLDENTGPENFLRYAFRLEVGNDVWQRLASDFAESFDRVATVASAPRRNQDRSQRSTAIGCVSSAEPRSTGEGPQASPGVDRFTNEPDTDWSLPQNFRWARDVVERWRDRVSGAVMDVPIAIAGETCFEGRAIKNSIDPSVPDRVVARFAQATADDADLAIACAVDDRGQWRRRSPAERCALLHDVAEELAANRGQLLGAMLAEGGKLLTESDPEISEAIDFCRFYGDSACNIASLPGVRCAGKGVVVVVSPWNFPLAIPCGGVAAALAAGNRVILKPASDTVLVAHLLCECFWRAGVPTTALQLLPCCGATVGQQVVSHAAVDAVILTGGTATARQMLSHCPTMNLLAETGGKNATIVTALADRDLAIKHVLHSAFSHSGQKCSATSLLILEQEVYENSTFRETLCDAVESLEVGSAWQLHTRVGPLIRPPTGELERGLKELERGESWAVMPRMHVDDNPHLVGPGVKWGVSAGSFTHCTEFFGPLLSVMPARNLHEAIDLANSTGYGLTSGLESLDPREHEVWQEGIRAGNLYINRSTTGAIVLRQPFGGMGKSAIGPGIKAGGPNYVVPLMNLRDADEASGPHTVETPAAAGVIEADDIAVPPRSLQLPHESLAERRQHLHALRDGLLAVSGGPAELQRDAPRVAEAIDGYLHWIVEEFEQPHDHFRLVGEDNFRRYLPVENLCIRMHADDTLFETFARAAAARAAGCRSLISLPVGHEKPSLQLLDQLTDPWAGAIEFLEESDESLAQRIHPPAASVDGPPAPPSSQPLRSHRLRYASADRVPRQVRVAAAQSFSYVADAPVLAHGRIELLWYFQEQSLSHVYHRYGNLGVRADEPRAEVL